MIMEPWWVLNPEKYREELEALDQAGIEYTIDQKVFDEGILCLYVKTEIAGKLRIIFPDLYPYFRFEIYADDVDLRYHQNPFTKVLCLLGRSTDNWRPSYTLAFFITTQLPKVLQAGASNNLEEVEEIEEHQAEPFTDYYPCLPDTAVIVSSDCNIPPNYNSGTLLVGVASIGTHVLQGAVLNVQDEEGNILMQSDERLMRIYSEDQLSARWVRLQEPPKILNQAVLFKHLQERDPHPDKMKSHRVNGGKLNIRAAVFPDETHKWRQSDYGWIFVCGFMRYKSHGK